jgi:predicted O-linked N-acetylglucosamine transferase (SPINDLY family)
VSAFVAALARGAAHLEAGEFEQAERICEQILRSDPQHAAAWHQLGLVCVQQGDHEKAADCLGRAVFLEPAEPAYQIEVGRAYAQLGRSDEAIESFQQAIFLAPDNPQPHFLLGCVLHRRGDLIGAELRFEQVVRLDPQSVAAWTLLGSLYNQLGRGLEAESCYREVLKNSSDLADVWSNLTLLLHDQLKLTDTPSLWRSVATIDPFSLDFPANLALIQAVQTLTGRSLGNGLSLAESADLPSPHFAVERIFADECDRSETPGYDTQDCQAPIQIGVVTPFLLDHAIGDLIGGILGQLSRTEFIVTAFIPGDVTAESRSSLLDFVDRVVPLSGDLATAQQRMCDAGPEILIYPDLGLDALGTALAQSRIAGVQCAFWGRPLAAKMSTIDFVFSSQYFAAAAASHPESAKLKLLESLGVYFERPAIDRLRTRDDARREFGLPQRQHLYFCPQPLLLLEPEFDLVARAILENDVAARIVLVESECRYWNEKLSVRLRDNLAALADRVIFTDRCDCRAVLRLMAAVDVMLDPPHFGGGLTSFQALGSGLPVVTLPAALPFDQVTAGCYRKMQFEACVVRTLQEYVDLAIRLGTDAEFNARIRTEITNRNSAIVGDLAAVREFEQFFRMVHRQFLQAQSTQPAAA